MRALRLLAALGVAVAVACASGEAERSTPARPAAPADAETCEEHGVLEVVCTKCNPALIPVFQAKGDWRPEHGFPMSFCPIHHPERGGRPVADAASDGAPADGTRIRFETRETAELAGLATATAARSAEEGGVEATARLTWDATRAAVLSARAPGVVSRLVADVGAEV